MPEGVSLTGIFYFSREQFGAFKDIKGERPFEAFLERGERSTDTEFAAALERHGDMVYRLAFSSLRRREDAEDVVQETFLKLYRREAGFKSEEHMRFWLVQVAVNECHRLARAWARYAPMEELEDAAAPEPESREALEALLKLPEKLRVASYLYYCEGYSTREVARLTGAKEPTVRTRLMRARERIRKYLEEESYGQAYRAFENVRLSDKRREMILSAALNEGAARRRGRGTVRTVCAAALAGAVLTCTALAAGTGGFFDALFGGRGQADRGSSHVEYRQGSDILPGENFEDVDHDAAERLLGDYVTKIDGTAAAGDYTLTVGQLLMDENGVGAFVYTVENEGGLPEIAVQRDVLPAGRYSAEEFVLSLRDENGLPPSGVDLLDLDGLTEKTLRGVYYFTDLRNSGTFYAGLVTVTGEGESLRKVRPEETVAVRAESIVPALGLSCGELSASLSPMSLVLNPPEPGNTEFWHVDGERDTCETTIRYLDGTSYTVVSWGLGGDRQNTVDMYLDGNSGREYYIFNRLVDVENVASVTVTVNDSAYVFTAGT